MDLDKIFDEMSEEEKQNYFNKNAMEYYQYIKQMPLFTTIESKLNSQEKLNDEEWNYILSKLFLVFVRSLGEENRIGLAGKIVLLFSKLNMKVLKQNSPLYNRVYKIMQLMTSKQQEAEINDDIYDGICVVSYLKNEENLEKLLEQYNITNQFRESKDAFFHETQTTPFEEISTNEKLYIHAFNHAYEEEKKLVKKYFQKDE